MQAKKLGLKGDGHGGWIDRAGKVVARTEDGKLKFTEKRTSKGQEEPKADTQKTSTDPQPKTKEAPAAEPARSAATEPAPEDQAQEISPLTIVFGRFNPPTVGHDKLLKSAVRISAGGDVKIYPSRTQDPKKNRSNPYYIFKLDYPPLSYFKSTVIILFVVYNKYIHEQIIQNK
jgi:hypothetical protein